MVNILLRKYTDKEKERYLKKYRVLTLYFNTPVKLCTIFLMCVILQLRYNLIIYIDTIYKKL